MTAATLTRQARAVPAVAVSLALALAACAQKSVERKAERRTPAPVAEAVAVAVEKEPAGLASIRGDELLQRIRSGSAKGTLVNAWASWCGPCRREIPMLQAIAENLRSEGVEVLLVSVDEPDQVLQAESFLRDNKIIIKSYIAARPLELFKRTVNPRWPGMLPASFLFDDKGKLRYFWGGEAFENEILPIIDGFLAGQPIDGEANFGLAPGQVVP
ncbi:MAG TPA: TlpA disulfide reductase family protein [Polyangiaceae bacterium]|jgi:thiol-disulfide isomerase/thioredoxin|nr:TlpA disulfide reductase family protein [Polyangiaceae bacterium]